MEQIIFSIDPSGFYFYFWFLVVIAMILGTSLYLLLRRPHLRRSALREGTPVSVLWSMVIALVIALPVMVYAYIDSWTHFYSVDIRDNRLRMNYLFPARTVVISGPADLKAIPESEVRKGVRYRIRIRVSDSREYSSQSMSGEQLHVNLSRLNASLSEMGQRQGTTD